MSKRCFTSSKLVYKIFRIFEKLNSLKYIKKLIFNVPKINLKQTIERTKQSSRERS